MATSKRSAAPAVRRPQTAESRSAGVAGPLHVLLIEDNHGDVRLVREALDGPPGALELTVVYEGVGALSLLRGSVRKPDLILLDLNLPRMDGRSLLSRIKGDPRLRRIPVIVLTSSASLAEVNQSYDLHANCYLVKPSALDDYKTQIRRTLEYWSEVVRLPDRG